MKSAFAKRQLEKHGWKEGDGLGRDRDGMSDPIKVTLKMDKTGVGHDPGKEFTDHWWMRAFNDAAKKIKTADMPGTEEKSKKMEMSEKKKKLYKGFVKASTLTNGCEKKNSDVSSSDDEEELNTEKTSIPTLDDIHRFCDGATGHRAARFGIKMKGKLNRVAAHDEQFEEKLKTNPKISYLKKDATDDVVDTSSGSEENIRTKKQEIKRSNEVDEVREESEGQERKERKKKKKRKEDKDSKERRKICDDSADDNIRDSHVGELDSVELIKRKKKKKSKKEENKETTKVNITETMNNEAHEETEVQSQMELRETNEQCQDNEVLVNNSDIDNDNLRTEKRKKKKKSKKEDNKETTIITETVNNGVNDEAHEEAEVQSQMELREMTKQSQDNEVLVNNSDIDIDNLRTEKRKKKTKNKKENNKETTAITETVNNGVYNEAHEEAEVQSQIELRETTKNSKDVEDLVNNSDIGDDILRTEKRKKKSKKEEKKKTTTASITETINNGVNNVAHNEAQIELRETTKHSQDDEVLVYNSDTGDDNLRTEKRKKKRKRKYEDCMNIERKGSVNDTLINGTDKNLDVGNEENLGEEKKCRKKKKKSKMVDNDTD